MASTQTDGSNGHASDVEEVETLVIGAGPVSTHHVAMCELLITRLD